MPEFTIESNGRIEKTAIYYNGDQLAGVREIFLNIDEEGTFDAVVQYTGSDGQLYTKQVFTDYFENATTREPAFTEEEAQMMRQLTVISEGDIDTAIVLIDGEEQFGIVSLLVHIKSATHTSGGLRSWFAGKKDVPERPEFKVQITYRNEDDSLSTEGVF